MNDKPCGCIFSHCLIVACPYRHDPPKPTTDKEEPRGE